MGRPSKAQLAQCAHHFCTRELPEGRAANPRSKYCSDECYRNAKQWRWRQRHPGARSRERVRAAKRRFALKSKAATIRRNQSDLAKRLENTK